MYGYLLSGLGAILVWLFYYAYKHPGAYHKRFPILLGVICSLFLSGMSWSMSENLALTRVIPYLQPSKVAEVQQLIKATNTSYYLLIITMLIINFYLLALCFIHKLLGIDADKKV